IPEDCHLAINWFHPRLAYSHHMRLTDPITLLWSHFASTIQDGNAILQGVNRGMREIQWIELKSTPLVQMVKNPNDVSLIRHVEIGVQVQSGCQHRRTGTFVANKEQVGARHE